MPKKVVEQEEELDIQAGVTKETFATRWFRDYAVNDARELKIVCDLTARSAKNQFSLFVDTGNTQVYAIVFYATFKTIIKYIKTKQKTYNDFTLEISNSVNLGYTNRDDENNEKVGNFTPIMEYIGVNKSIVDGDTDSNDPEKTTKNFIRWKELNIRTNVEYYKEIQEEAYKLLISEYRTNLRTSEAIIPLFCIFMDHIINVLKQKYNELDGTKVSEVHMNVFSLFDVYYSFDEDDDQEIIEFQPGIPMKTALKSDEIASRGN